MTTAALPPDPIACLRDITAEQIIERLDALEAEAKGLRTLLRSVQARERARARARAAKPNEVQHA